MINGIPNRPLYFYQEDIIVWNTPEYHGLEGEYTHIWGILLWDHAMCIGMMGLFVWYVSWRVGLFGLIGSLTSAMIGLFTNQHECNICFFSFGRFWCLLLREKHLNSSVSHHHFPRSNLAILRYLVCPIFRPMCRYISFDTWIIPRFYFCHFDIISFTMMVAELKAKTRPFQSEFQVIR